MTSKPASRRARAITFAPRSCPSRPGLATKTRIGCDRVGGAAGVSVDIKSLPGYPSEFAGGDQPAEEGSGAIFVVADIALQDGQDGQADIESNQVGQCQWTHRMRHAQLHDLVDRVTAGDTLAETEDRLVDHRHQDAVRDKTGKI